MSALPLGSQSVGGGQYKVGIELDLDENGRLTIAAADGSPLDPRVERKIRAEHRDRLEAWLASRCDEINGESDQLADVHLGTAAPDADHHVPAEPFRTPPPNEPALPPGSGWDRVFPWRRRAREEQFERAQRAYEYDRNAWDAARAAHEQDWERRRSRSEDERSTSSPVMHELLEEALSAISWPRETLVSFEVDDTLTTLHLDVDLPEIELMPSREAAIAERGLKLNLHARSAAQVRKEYARHVHGVVFRVVGAGFATLPTIHWVVCSAYSQRLDPATGTVRDEYLISVRVPRDAWSRIDFSHLSSVDPAAALARFGLRTDCDASGHMSPVQPFPIGEVG